MSIIINGMEMPEDGETATLTICADGLVFEEFKEPGDVFHAVPVPPHGRLIDEKDICDKIRPLIENPYCYNRLQIISETLAHCLQIISDAPTIIPAEEGE